MMSHAPPPLFCFVRLCDIHVQCRATLNMFKNDLRERVDGRHVPRPDVVYVVDDVGYSKGDPNAQASWVEHWLPDLANAVQLGKDGIVVLNDDDNFVGWKRAVENVLLPDHVAPAFLDGVRMQKRQRPTPTDDLAYDVAAVYAFPDQRLVLRVWPTMWESPDQRCRTIDGKQYADYPLGFKGVGAAEYRRRLLARLHYTTAFDEIGECCLGDDIPTESFLKDRTTCPMTVSRQIAIDKYNRKHEEPVSPAASNEHNQEAQQANAGGSSGERNECVICMDGKSQWAVVPCGHLVVCADCTDSVGARCPMCRGEVLGTMRIFQS